MSFELDFLKLRRPVLNYVSPPICEVIFSSTGVVIVLDPINPLGAPTGLALGGPGGRNLVWDVFPNTICYNVYESVNANDPFGPYVLVSECNPDPDYPNPKLRCYRVSAITLDGESALSDPFCISTVAPSVETDPATDILNTSAILNGTVNPNGFACSVYFQWGLDLSYGDQTPPQVAGSGIVDLSFDDLIESLSQNTTYHFRAAATNGEFTIFGGDMEFTTSGGSGPTDPAPCSLFETDNTGFGTITMDAAGMQGGPGAGTFFKQLTGLPIGSYEWQYTSNAFHDHAAAGFTVNPFDSVCSTLDPTLSHQYFNGESVVPPSGTIPFPPHTFPNDGFPTTGYPSAADAQADYLTQNPAGALFIKETGGSASIFTCGAPVTFPGEGPTFDLKRVLKLSEQQPLTLKINNLAGIVSSCASDPVDVTSPVWNGETVVRDLNLAQWKESAAGEGPGAFRINGVRFAQFTVGLVNGAAAPVSGCTAAINGGGSVDAGAHSWKIAFSTGTGGQSGGSPASNVLILGGPSEVGLTNIPVGPPGITRRHIYRTLAGGSEYYFIGTIFNNVDTTFTDNTDDTTLFNGGFVTQMKPASCFWACNVEVLGLFDIPAVMWAGVKLVGQTPEGIYQVSQPYIGNGPFFCPYSTSGLLASIEISGTF